MFNSRRWDIGVASYGALEHVPPQLTTISFFQLTLELHKVWQRLCPVASSCSATAAAVVQSRLHEPRSVYYFASFYVRQKFSCNFVPRSHQILATPLRWDTVLWRHCYEYVAQETAHNTARQKLSNYSERRPWRNDYHGRLKINRTSLRRHLVKPWFHVKIKLFYGILMLHGTTSEMK